jgi:16S rRNA (cytosine967-C5)-methyltransferase
MVYSTCSLLAFRKRETSSWLFWNQEKDSFELVDQKWILPSEGYDGFYMALIKRSK